MRAAAGAVAACLLLAVALHGGAPAPPRPPHFVRPLPNLTPAGGPAIALCYCATGDRFPLVLRSLFSLVRVLEPRPRFCAVAVHLLYLARGIPLSRYGRDLAALRALSPLPIAVHARFNRTWLAPWAAARRGRAGRRWVAQFAARLFLHRVVAADFILYVDADTVWGRDFRAELARALRARPGMRIYACRDCSAYRPDAPPWFLPYLEEKGHAAQCFVNTGVFLLRNHPAEIERRMGPAVRKFNRASGMWPDQDVVNYMWSCDEKAILPPEWNNHRRCLDAITGRRHALGDAIVHHGHDLEFAEIDRDWDIWRNAQDQSRSKPWCNFRRFNLLRPPRAFGSILAAVRRVMLV